MFLNIVKKANGSLNSPPSLPLQLIHKKGKQFFNYDIIAIIT